MTARHTLTPYTRTDVTCRTCGKPVPAWHNPKACGCGGRSWNTPCRHRSGVTVAACPDRWRVR